MYELICASTQGSDHIRRGIPCEDSGLVYESDACRIFAVADGHGDSNCPRSSFGSKAACEIAVSEMKEFCSAIMDNTWESRLFADNKDTESLVRQLFVSIMAKWIRKVNEDIDANPLTEEERAGCERYIERYDRGERLEHIYGTTLIAGLLTERYLLLLQQGDGRCVVFHQDGSVSEPIPWDEKCFANVTTSLCDEDAIQRFRYCVINMERDPIIACLAGSDGVEDSYLSKELMYSYYRDLLTYAGANGAFATNEYLSETLPEFSKKGSGDDVTICGVVDCVKASEYASVFERDNKIVRTESQIHDIDERLKSMNGMGKLDALKGNYERAEKELAEAEEEYSEAFEHLQSYESDLQQFRLDEIEGSELFRLWNRIMDYIFPGNREEALDIKEIELQNRAEQSEGRLQKARKEFESAEREYREFTARKEAYEKEKDDLMLQLAIIRES